ncbi:MAG: low molecular weight phosphatase family protein [Pirellulales bacterium]
MKRILFLCSGNYYRSRFAEVLFNWHASERGLGWRAESRGLALDGRNAGPMSRYTVSHLAARGISWAEYLREPLPVTEPDFAAADRVVAVKESEHRPIVEARFSSWRHRVEYWHVHDLDCSAPDATIAHLEREVLVLLSGLTAKAA